MLLDQLGISSICFYVRFSADYFRLDYFLSLINPLFTPPTEQVICNQQALICLNPKRHSPSSLHHIPFLNLEFSLEIENRNRAFTPPSPHPWRKPTRTGRTQKPQYPRSGCYEAVLPAVPL